MGRIHMCHDGLVENDAELSFDGAIPNRKNEHKHDGNSVLSVTGEPFRSVAPRVIPGTRCVVSPTAPAYNPFRSHQRSFRQPPPCDLRGPSACLSFSRFC